MKQLTYVDFKIILVSTFNDVEGKRKIENIEIQELIKIKNIKKSVMQIEASKSNEDENMADTNISYVAISNLTKSGLIDLKAKIFEIYNNSEFHLSIYSQEKNQFNTNIF